VEFWQVIRFYKKYLLSLLLLSLVISLAAGLAATRLPPSFEATQSIFVRREIQSPSESFYSYDGYYSQQAAERFTDTVVGFLKNKETVRKAAKNSGFGASTEEASRLASALRIKRVAPQLVTVSFSAGRKERAVSLVDNLTKEVGSLSASLNAKGDKFLVLSPIEPTPFVEDKQFVPLIVALSAFISVFFFSSLILAVFEAVKERSGRK